jgi:hypothetical protein
MLSEMVSKHTSSAARLSVSADIASCAPPILGPVPLSGVNVYLGIRYTGGFASDAPGQMTLGEATIIDGTGVQTTTNSRWGDYT